jgi:choice-of-anchor A domain-containing protein
MSKQFVVSAAVIGAAVVASTFTTAGAASPLSTWSVVVQNDLTSTSEVEGRAAVGRDLLGPASNYGTKLTPASNYLGTDVLLVGRNIQVTNVNMSAGNIRLGGVRSGNANFNGGGVQVSDPNAAATVANLFAETLAASSFLSGQAATNTVTIPNGQPGPVNFNAIANGNGVAFFSVSGSALLSNNLVQQIDLNFNGASSVIINVSGTTINFNQGNMVGNLANEANGSRILWNFYEATSVVLDRRVVGAVLAPLANLRNTTVIAGSVSAKNFQQDGEVHLPVYTGFIPTPGSAGLLAAGGLLALRRKR